MKYSIVNKKVNDNFIIEGDTITDCQSLTIDELTKRGWDMIDCDPVLLTEPLGNIMADCLDKMLHPEDTPHDH